MPSGGSVSVSSSSSSSSSVIGGNLSSSSSCSPLAGGTVFGNAATGSRKIPFWKIYEIWEYNNVAARGDSHENFKSKLTGSIPNTASSSCGGGGGGGGRISSGNNAHGSSSSCDFVEMTVIGDMLYILIQDE